MVDCCGWRFIARCIGCLASLLLFIGGIFTVVSLKFLCWTVGIYMVCCGVLVGMLEAPFVYGMIECTKPLVNKLQLVLPWHRAILYACLAAFMFACIGGFSLVCALLMVLTAFCYGMIWLGPRGGQKPTAEQQQEKESLVAAEMEEGKAEPAAAAAAPTAAKDADGAYPWEKFMNKVTASVGKAAGEAAAKAVLEGGTAKLTGSLPADSSA